MATERQIPPLDHGTTKTVDNAKDDALSDIEFERFFEAAGEMDSYYGAEGQVLALLLGRLGLRAGEASHLQRDWVDASRQMLVIPRHEPCESGRDGGICGQCRQAARGRAARNPFSEADALGWRWHPKTEAAAREIYYGFSARCELFVERFVDHYEGWPYSQQSINRRVTRAADRTPGLDPDRITPHVLRASAATYHVGRGISMQNLMQIMGWADEGVAERYVKRSGSRSARQLAAIHSR